MLCINKYILIMNRDLFADVEFDDLFINEPPVHVITPAEEELIRMLPSELKAINERVTQLETALSTQALLLALERTKRQKLKLLIKRRQPEVPATPPETLKQLVDSNTLYQEAVNYQFGNSIDRLSTVTFRCFSRMQQLMTFAIPSILVTPSDYPDAANLLEEIGRTIQQLCVHQTTPNSQWSWWSVFLINIYRIS